MGRLVGYLSRVKGARLDERVAFENLSYSRSSKILRNLLERYDSISTSDKYPGTLDNRIPSALDDFVLDGQTFTRVRLVGILFRVDISLASQRLAVQIEDWQVIEDYTGSDHKYITIPDKRAPPQWNIDKMNPKRLLGDSTRTASLEGDPGSTTATCASQDGD